MTRRRWPARDRGSGTIYALAVIAVVATIAFGAASVGGAVVTRHRAMAAADLAALAAADALARAEPDPCAAASRIAARHDVELVGCATSGAIVDVVVEAPLRGALGFGLGAQMRARAGPGGLVGSAEPG